MPATGTITQWNDLRGFGFIDSEGMQVFFHVRDFRASSGMRPVVGMAVRFELIHVGGKGPRAMAVAPAGETRRTPESQLHLLSLLGGWPAAWWAQRAFRHKTVKASFQQVYVASAVAHCVALGTWLSGMPLRWIAL